MRLFENIVEPSERLKALFEYAEGSCQVNHETPARRYFRSGGELIRMANVYYDEKNNEAAYLLYTRAIILFLDKLRQHPEYKSVPGKEKSQINQKIRDIVLPRAEELKAKLKKEFAVIAERKKEEQKKQEELLAKELEKQKLIEEQKKREEEAHRKRVEEYKELEEKKKLELLKKEERERQIQEERLRLYEEEKKILNTRGAYLDNGQISNNAQQVVGAAGSIDLPPPYEPSAPPLPQEDIRPTAPIVDRSSKPRVNHHTSIGGTSHNAHGLKDVICPADLMPKFLHLATANTARNVETCGILAGKLRQGAFTITNLLVPKQSGTSDSCSAEDEEAIFDYQDKHDLITLGWIHTHPSQTAFMSSVDLHTHAGYQMMMPEAIAIVISPKYQETGFFLLTPDYGLDYVANCRQKGFHKHPEEPPLYEQSSHVQIVEDQHIVVADLRH
ncbi:STAM-binding protein-like [Lingula anatina]|uniref:STAM-binding protein-like n=1 Tax=Lingula anatina TaxID=7574 RepID=A0A1S3IE74_LINAN|nr:STAM-binding protein-like [Lingula anatina]|eukprot:XP_013396532.1 STAM-binding protein-like [Lingula anatina]